MFGCMQRLPNRMASFIFLQPHGFCGCAGCQRKLPVGGRAYGNPRNIHTESEWLEAMPLTQPKPGMLVTGVASVPPELPKTSRAQHHRTR